MGIVSEYWHLQDYWQPVSLFGTGVFSIEDVLFGFGAAALGAMLPLYIFKLQWPLKQKGRNTRIIFSVIGSLAVLIVLTTILGVNSIISTYIIFIVAIIFSLWKRLWLWRQMLVGAASLLAIGVFIYALWHLTGMFSWGESGVYILHQPWAPIFFDFLPLTEILWYVLWGMAAAGLPYFINGDKEATKLQ